MARVDNYEQRFGGIGRLYTPEGLARLRQAHVCVIGIGDQAGHIAGLSKHYGRVWVLQ